MAISMLKIKRPLGRLIFNMGIAIPGKTVFLIETAPCTFAIPIMTGSLWVQKFDLSLDWLFLWLMCRQRSLYIYMGGITNKSSADTHDDVIKWKHVPRNWPFMRGIHRSPVNSPHKGQERGALMFSLICVWLNGWVNNHEAGDLRRSQAHYDVIVMDTKRSRFAKQSIG